MNTAMDQLLSLLPLLGFCLTLIVLVWKAYCGNSLALNSVINVTEPGLAVIITST